MRQSYFNRWMVLYGMWNLIKRTAAVVCAVSCFAPAQAGWMSGNALLDNCTSKDEVVQLVCYGYVKGVVDATNMSGVSKGLAAGPITTPNGTTGQQMVDIVIKYLQAHPEQRHFVASDTVYIALKIAFKSTP